MLRSLRSTVPAKHSAATLANDAIDLQQSTGNDWCSLTNCRCSLALVRSATAVQSSNEKKLNYDLQEEKMEEEEDLRAVQTGWVLPSWCWSTGADSLTASAIEIAKKCSDSKATSSLFRPIKSIIIRKRKRKSERQWKSKMNRRKWARRGGGGGSITGTATHHWLTTDLIYDWKRK